MLFFKQAVSLVALLLFLAGTVAFSQDSPIRVSASLSPTDEAKIKSQITQFFASYSAADVTAMKSLWNERSPDFTPHMKGVEQILAGMNNVLVSSVAFERYLAEGDMVGVRVNAVFSGIEKEMYKPDKPYEVYEGYDSHNRLVTMVRAGSDWKIFRHVSAEKDFALRLLKEQSSDRQDQMLNDERELVNVDLAMVLTREGNRASSQAPNAEVLRIYRLGQRVAGRVGDQNQIMEAINNIALTLRNGGKYTEALQEFHRGLKLSEDGGNKDMASRLLGNIGMVHMQLDDYERAIDFSSRSFELGEAVGNKRVTANALGNLSNVYARKGNYRKSLEYNERALAAKQQIGDAAGIASAVHNIGLIYSMQGDSGHAIEYFTRSLKLAESAPNKASVALYTYNLGIAYKMKGDFAQAMSLYQRSLRLSEEIGYQAGIMGVCINIGNLYVDQGDFEQAEKYLLRAQVLADSLKSRYAANAILSNLATMENDRGNYLAAIKHSERALLDAEQTGNQRDVIANLTVIGENYLALGDVVRATERLQRAVALGESTGNNSLVFRAWRGLAKVSLYQNDYSKALEACERAKVYWRKSGAEGDDNDLDTVTGEAYKGLGNNAEAGKMFEGAIARVEDLTTRISGAEEESEAFFSKRIRPYHLMIDTLISQDRPAESFIYSERAKARSLLNVLGNGKLDVASVLSANEREQEQAYRNELVSLNAEISYESGRKSDGSRLADLREQLRAKRLQFAEFRSLLFTSHPELKIQRGEMRPIRVQEAASLLPDNKTAIAEFVVAEDKTFLFVITKDAAKQATLKAFTVDVKYKDLAKRVEFYRTKLASGDLDFHKASRELYDLLLKPATAQLAGKTNLIIVPDGPLWDLPFQALQNGKGRYLVEQASISYAPGLTALKEMSKKAKTRPRNADLELLAFGNPIVGKETAERVQRVFMSEKLEPLPESERLVNELGKMYGANRSEVYVGDQAREETAKTESPKYRIVQFATHGILSNVSPMYSHLVLAQNDKNPNEDGLLEAWEMKDLDLKADMVILSACETARGRISNGEGVIGMSWAMFIAGTPTTVASQWKVESKSTTELMLEFHRQLLKGNVSKAEALRRASLKVMKMPKYRHPSYWGAFVIVGNAN